MAQEDLYRAALAQSALLRAPQPVATPAVLPSVAAASYLTDAAQPASVYPVRVALPAATPAKSVPASNSKGGKVTQPSLADAIALTFRNQAPATYWGARALQAALPTIDNVVLGKETPSQASTPAPADSEKKPADAQQPVVTARDALDASLLSILAHTGQLSLRQLGAISQAIPNPAPRVPEKDAIMSEAANSINQQYLQTLAEAMKNNDTKAGQDAFTERQKNLIRLAVPNYLDLPGG